MPYLTYPHFQDERDWRLRQAEKVVEVQEEKKEQSAQTSKKGHKRRAFFKSDRPDVKSSPLLSRMLEPVVDPGKKAREAEFLKNPFRGFPR
jgi:hypothetical protein